MSFNILSRYMIPMNMQTFSHIFFLLGVVTLRLSVDQTDAGELTFELPDNEKMCFHEHVEKGVECVLEFQVRSCA